jgi:tetratricopeptide (TPR) repeat protein
MTRSLLASLVGVCGALALSGPAVAQPAATAGRTLVVPFENVKREGRYYWLSEAAAVLVTWDLEAAGAGPISRDERLKAFERLQVPPVASLTVATTIRLGQLIGAGRVLLGTFAVENEQVTVTSRVIELDSGRMRPDVVETGRLDDLVAVFERVSRALVPPGVSAPERFDVEHGSPQVFESYVKGLLAETVAARVHYLEAALKLSPQFAPAHLALWQAYTAQGDYAKAAATATGVPASSKQSRRARFLAAISRIQLKQYDEAFQALKALADEAPTAAILNNLGVVQSRRGGTPATGRATSYLAKAADAEPGDADIAFNLGYACWFERDLDASVRWLRESVRRQPADGDAHFVLAAALQATGATVEAERERELARQLSSVYVEWDQRPNAATEPVPRGLERLRDDIDTPRLSLAETLLAPREQKEQQDLAAFYFERGRRLYDQQQDREAIEELRRSLYLSPYQAQAHLLLGRVYLRTGRFRDAIDALKISIWSQDSAAAHAVLGEAYLQAKDTSRARTELQKALQLDPELAEARALAARIDGKQ